MPALPPKFCPAEARRSLIARLGLRGAALAVLALVALAGCSRDSGAGVRPDSPGLTAKEREIVTAARRAVAQFEDWADRAEFKFERRDNAWHVTAWRVAHPEAKGNKRYVPWGHRRLIIDDTGKVLEYMDGK